LVLFTQFAQCLRKIVCVRRFEDHALTALGVDNGQAKRMQGRAIRLIGGAL